MRGRFGTKRIGLKRAALYGLATGLVLGAFHYFVIGLGDIPRATTAGDFLAQLAGVISGYSMFFVPGFLIYARANNLYLSRTKQ
jgi:hypothetical protein